MSNKTRLLTTIVIVAISSILLPVGHVYYAASSLVCVPASLSYNGPALGAQAGEYSISQLVRKDSKRATQTPFNQKYEAKS